jgi:hypothetical protein
MVNKLSILLMVLLALFSASVVLAASSTVADIPNGFVPYVRTSAGSFPVRGDIVWVKAGLNPTITDFVPASEVGALTTFAGVDVDGYLRNVVTKAADPGLTSLADRKAGEIIGYGWGIFTYNNRFNRITPPAEGSDGNKVGTENGSMGSGY